MRLKKGIKTQYQGIKKEGGLRRSTDNLIKDFMMWSPVVATYLLLFAETVTSVSTDNGLPTIPAIFKVVIIIIMHIKKKNMVVKIPIYLVVWFSLFIQFATGTRELYYLWNNILFSAFYSGIFFIVLFLTHVCMYFFSNLKRKD